MDVGVEARPPTPGPAHSLQTQGFSAQPLCPHHTQPPTSFDPQTEESRDTRTSENAKLRVVWATASSRGTGCLRVRVKI